MLQNPWSFFPSMQGLIQNLSGFLQILSEILQISCSWNYSLCSFSVVNQDKMFTLCCCDYFIRTEKAQLTIFYCGKVLVFDDFPADKAEDLLQMASKESIAAQKIAFTAPSSSTGADCSSQLETAHANASGNHTLLIIFGNSLSIKNINYFMDSMIRSINKIIRNQRCKNFCHNFGIYACTDISETQLVAIYSAVTDAD